MALQDLTPQLRTRLSRMERAVGWFVFLATALLLFGFGYYIYHTAERKGWFKIKAPFLVYVQSSTGLNVGDSVYMMGFPVGQITSVQPQKPHEPHNVEVRFDVIDPFFRYLWTGGSYVKVNAAGFLNQRQLEVTRGTNGPAIVVTQPGVWKTVPELEQLVATETNSWQLYQDVLDANSNLVFGAYTMLNAANLQVLASMNLESNAVFVYDNTVKYKRIVASWDNRVRRYVNFAPDHDSAWLRTVETPPVSDQLQAMVAQVQLALPNILALTNKLSTLLENSGNATSNLNATIAEARPHLIGILTNTDSILASSDTNLTAILIHLSDLTSNLNAQVQANSNILSSVSKIVVDSDDFVQGLKHHWLLRSAFKVKATNAPPVRRK